MAANKFSVDERVNLVGNGLGTIRRARLDDRGDPIYTVYLDSGDPEYMLARDCELRAVPQDIIPTCDQCGLSCIEGHEIRYYGESDSETGYRDQAIVCNQCLNG